MSMLYDEQGTCTACGEHTSLGEPCCDAPVVYEGSTYTRDSVLEHDIDAGYLCGCDDCLDADRPCSLNCRDEDLDYVPCSGCRLAQDQAREDAFERNRK